MSVCRSCRQAIRWVVMAGSGRRMPLDEAPDCNLGTVMILTAAAGADEGRGVVLSGPALDKARADRGVDLYVSHFVTCPNANSHRRVPTRIA